MKTDGGLENCRSSKIWHGRNGINGRNWKSDEFLDYIDNIVIVQNGYLKWDQLKNKVEENDTKIRSIYQKKTLKTYNATYKAGMKAVSQKPNITNQATAEAECAPLEQLLKEQELFMNSTTPDAQ